MPIPTPSAIQDQIVSNIVDRIIDSSANGEVDSYLTDNLNKYIYIIYGLTYDEVMIVDPETSICREEYDNFNINDIDLD